MLDPSLSIENGGRSLCRAGEWQAADVYENAAKLYAPVSGEGWVTVGGQTTALTPGHLYLLPPQTGLSWGTPDKLIVDWAHFRLDPPWLEMQLSRARRVWIFHGRTARRWTGLCRNLQPFFQHRRASLACRIQAMLLEITGLALESTMENAEVVSPMTRRLLPVLAHLDRCALQKTPPNLSELASLVYLSPEHFHRQFRATLGLTPLGYILRLRMRQAQRMLSDPTNSIAEIADACGYADPFYFSRVFHRHTGRPPRQYRALASRGP